MRFVWQGAQLRTEWCDMIAECQHRDRYGWLYTERLLREDRCGRLFWQRLGNWSRGQQSEVKGWWYASYHYGVSLAGWEVYDPGFCRDAGIDLEGALI